MTVIGSFIDVKHAQRVLSRDKNKVHGLSEVGIYLL